MRALICRQLVRRQAKRQSRWSWENAMHGQVSGFPGAATPSVANCPAPAGVPALAGLSEAVGSGDGGAVWQVRGGAVGAGAASARSA